MNSRKKIIQNFLMLVLITTGIAAAVCGIIFVKYNTELIMFG